MSNPWEAIPLDDYENHMKLASVLQLQTLNRIMKGQFSAYPVKTAMVLGVAGGNGLEHIDTAKFERVYGVDINETYLAACTARYPHLQPVFRPIRVNLLEDTSVLPPAELLVANLLIEYVGYEVLQRAVLQVKPVYVSCAIQINTDDSFVSDSPYLHAFDRLDEVHWQIEEGPLEDAMAQIRYAKIARAEEALPNGKKLVRMDFRLLA